MDRLGRVVKSEWNARFGRDDDKAGKHDNAVLRSEPVSPAPLRPPRGPTVSDVDGALRVLELSGTPTLDEVRSRHRELSRRYHPKTISDQAEEAHAAQVVLEALTDALELLEEHLLPLAGESPGPAAR